MGRGREHQNKGSENLGKIRKTSRKKTQSKVSRKSRRQGGKRKMKVSKQEYAEMFSARSEASRNADMARNAKHTVKGAEIAVSSKKDLTSKMDWEGVDTKQSLKLAPMMINGKYYTRADNAKTKKDAQELVDSLRKRRDVQDVRIKKTKFGWSVFVRFREGSKLNEDPLADVPKKPGYVIKGDKVYYRTKKGKEGSMPLGHLKMIQRWGLKEVKHL